ncbi:MAG: DNA/RNA nuclease SfsA [Spirochaetes bacterium]|nr:DNA/RNA nuclease SfsA [Spirochaetota bacterium]
MLMGHTLSVADGFDEAVFLGRTDDRTIRILYEGEETSCYLPASKDEEAILFLGSKIFVCPSNRLPGGFSHMAVSTEYQKGYTLLDRGAAVRIASELIKRGLLFGPLCDISGIRRSPRNGPERFDLIVTRRTQNHLFVTVEPCTICHNGVALYPDGAGVRTLPPRGTPAGYCQYLLFFVSSPRARIFLPNVHEDPLFCRSLVEAGQVDFSAVRCPLVDPVTVDLDCAADLACDLETVRKTDTKRGSYLLLLKNTARREIPVGTLGRVSFEEGYYVYVGSGMNGVDARVARHKRGRKRHHWHIDRITPSPMRITRVYIIRGNRRLEDDIAGRMERIAPRRVEGFGSSDSNKSSHLFYFPDPPNHRRDFMGIVMDYMTFFIP